MKFATISLVLLSSVILLSCGNITKDSMDSVPRIKMEFPPVNSLPEGNPGGTDKEKRTQSALDTLRATMA